jgi:hypothetical protein
MMVFQLGNIVVRVRVRVRVRVTVRVRVRQYSPFSLFPCRF